MKQTEAAMRYLPVKPRRVEMPTVRGGKRVGGGTRSVRGNLPPGPATSADSGHLRGDSRPSRSCSMRGSQHPATRCHSGQQGSDWPQGPQSSAHKTESWWFLH